MAQLAREAVICASSIKRHSTGGFENDKRAREVLLAALGELFYPTDHHYSLKLSPHESEAFSKKGAAALGPKLDGKVLAQIIQGRAPLFKIETVDPQTAQAEKLDGERS
jgi:hypothetical protein